MKVQMQDAGARVYDVEAPDDAALDQVEKAASASAGRELKVIDKPGKAAYAGDMFKRGFSGLMSMAGLPVDAMTYALNKLPGVNINKPVGGSQQIREGYEGLTQVQHTPAPSKLSKWLVGKPAEFAGASVLPSAAVISKATKPLQAAATEGASAYAGGVGMGVGEDVGEAAGRGVARAAGTDEDTGAHAGRTLGAFGGGIAAGGGTAMLAPRAVGAGVDAVKRAIKIPALRDSEEMTRITNSMFTKHFREALLSDPRFKANIEETLGTKEAINKWLETGSGPGGARFEPDLSMAAGTPSVKFLQQLAETESPAAAAKGVASRQKVDQALSAYRDGNFPAGEKSLQDLSAAELGTMEKDVAARQAKLEQDMGALHAKVRTGQFGPDEGLELAQLKRDQMKAATAQTDARYGQVYKEADQLGFQGSLDPVVAYIQRYQRDPNRVAQDAPGFMGDLVSAAREGSAQTRRTMMQKAFGEDKLPESITQFVAKQGGLNKTMVGGDGLVDVSATPSWALKGEGKKGSSFYLQHNGPTAKSPDAMREQLVEAGYLPEKATIDDMYRAIEEEIFANGPQNFAVRDVDRAYEVLAKRKAETDEQMGGSNVGFERDARYPASFGVLHSVLKRVREEQRYYAGKQTDEARRAMGPLNELEKITLQQIEKAGPSVGEKLSGADEFFKSTVAEPFYRGVAARAFQDRGLIENVGDRLLRRGEEGAKNFKQVFGESERANDLLWNGTLEAMAKSIGEKEVTPARVKAFYEDHRKFLDQFPTIRNRIFAVDQVAEGLESRVAELASQKRAVNQDLMATLTNSQNPEATLLRVVGNDQQMRQVAGWAKKNPELGKEIVRTYVEAMEGMRDPVGFFQQNATRLQPLFEALGPNHWDNVLTLARGRMIEARGAPEPVLKPEVVDDPLKVLTGTGTSGIFSRIRGAVYRQISPEYVIVDVGGKYFFRVHKERARELVNEALYDPKLAENIIKLEHELVLPKPDHAKIRDLMGEMKWHYANHGLRVTTGAFGVSTEDPAEHRAYARGERAMQQRWRRQ